MSVILKGRRVFGSKKIQILIAAIVLLISGILFYQFYWKKRKGSSTPENSKEKENLSPETVYIKEKLLSDGKKGYIRKAGDKQFLATFSLTDKEFAYRYNFRDDGTIFVDDVFENESVTKGDNVHALVLTKSRTAKLLELDYESYYADVPRTQANSTRDAWEKSLIPTSTPGQYKIDNILPDGSEYELIANTDKVRKYIAYIAKDAIIITTEDPNTVVCRVKKVMQDENFSYLEFTFTERGHDIFYHIAAVALFNGQIVL